VDKYRGPVKFDFRLVYKWISEFSLLRIQWRNLELFPVPAFLADFMKKFTKQMESRDKRYFILNSNYMKLSMLPNFQLVLVALYYIVSFEHINSIKFILSDILDELFDITTKGLSPSATWNQAVFLYIYIYKYYVRYSFAELDLRRAVDKDRRIIDPISVRLWRRWSPIFSSFKWLHDNDIKQSGLNPFDWILAWIAEHSSPRIAECVRRILMFFIVIEILRLLFFS
jgi:hypothetical protein